MRRERYHPSATDAVALRVTIPESQFQSARRLDVASSLKRKRQVRTKRQESWRNIQRPCFCSVGILSRGCFVYQVSISGIVLSMTQGDVQK
jgi:hypothetical protein